jgi:hypothetical protein
MSKFQKGLYYLFLLQIFKSIYVTRYSSTLNDWILWKQEYMSSSLASIANDYYNETERYNIFVDSIDYINTINSQNLAYSLAPSRFADLTFEEYQRILYLNQNCMNYLQLNFKSRFKVQRFNGLIKNNNFTSILPSVDYSYIFNSNNITNGNWIDTLNDLINGLFKLLTGVTLNQNFDSIISKNNSNTTCITANIADGIQNLKNITIQKNDYYLKINDFGFGHYNYNYILQDLQTQLILVLYNSNNRDYQFYENGIYTQNCNNSHSYNMVGIIVGYGYDNINNINYWKIRNNWGANWGNEGYIKLLRNNCTNTFLSFHLNDNAIQATNVSNDPSYNLELILLFLFSFLIIAFTITASVLFYKST